MRRNKSQASTFHRSLPFIHSFILYTLLIIIYLLSFTSNAKTPLKTFSLVTAVYPPYNYQDGMIKGLNIEIIQAAMQSQGYQVEVQILPFSRALAYAKQGKVDGITLWHAKDREQWFHFSKPFSQSPLVLYKSAALDFSFKDFDDLEPYTIGTVQKYAYPKDFSSHKNLKKSAVLNDEQNIMKLIYGRIDIALIDQRIAKYLLAKNRPLQQHLFNSAGTIKVEDYYVGISKKTVDPLVKLSAFNRGLALIRKNGELDKIVARYN